MKLWNSPLKVTVLYSEAPIGVEHSKVNTDLVALFSQSQHLVITSETSSGSDFVSVRLPTSSYIIAVLNFHVCLSIILKYTDAQRRNASRRQVYCACAVAMRTRPCELNLKKSDRCSR